ncbi:MAG: mannose-1-phosphate guanylyltransferase [Chitinophagales bacterium]|nr:mannose-1-phosphate guanylyltransferase [Chitinophagales bacterium]HAE13292.1 mannose-1-phosphate guanylyltransferase [Bacteroidota bacterium]MCB9019646.1 mannose-1-phosphate guanylyltransferase [Chitinophagales bacterium]MCB9021130.1 mannose-1-phosphate guanylyltransferase [Chitinophagales bacterium]HPE96505.1 mannose-1-phosphate guanylyltransferase [Chitinophagales bacterium]
MDNVYVAIMAGGIGSRFWPESRASKPKQFLDILNTGETLIQTTFRRFLKIVAKDNIFIVTNEDYVGLILEQIPDVNPANILAEPARRNTAPCVAYVSHKIAAINPDARVVVAPSDHLILNEPKFLEFIGKALQHTETHDHLVTLGIHPTRPDTGYGYIQFTDREAAPGIFKVKTFTEKPNLELAVTFLRSGDFLWNAGIFIWKVEAILDAFDHHLQDMHQAFWQARKMFGHPEEKAAIEKAYSLCTNISIDYGIMEKADNVFVIPASFGWSDLGTWASLWNNYNRDYWGNAVKGKKVMIYDSKDCMVMAPDDKLVILQGLDEYIIIDQGDVLLICKKEHEQEIKNITADVKRRLGDRFL